MKLLFFSYIFLELCPWEYTEWSSLLLSWYYNFTFVFSGWKANVFKFHTFCLCDFYLNFVMSDFVVVVVLLPQMGLVFSFCGRILHSVVNLLFSPTISSQRAYCIVRAYMCVCMYVCFCWCCNADFKIALFVFVWGESLVEIELEDKNVKTL